MTRFSPDEIDTTNDMPAWVETEEKYRMIEDKEYATDPNFVDDPDAGLFGINHDLGVYCTCSECQDERLTERQIAYQARTRPFSASWSYVEGGSISTMPPRIVNTDPTLHVQL